MLDKSPVLPVVSKTTVGATLDIMNQLEVTTLAVHGAAGHWLGEAQLVCGDKQYIGMVSIIDVLAFLMKDRDAVEARVMRYITDAMGSTPESLSVWTEHITRPLFSAWNSSAVVHIMPSVCPMIPQLSRRC